MQPSHTQGIVTTYYIRNLIVSQERQTQERQTKSSANAGKTTPKKKANSNMRHPRTDSEGAIGEGLRSLYQDVVKEPLPDDIMALLDQLQSKQIDVND